MLPLLHNLHVEVIVLDRALMDVQIPSAVEEVVGGKWAPERRACR